MFDINTLWSKFGKKADLARVGVVELTQREYYLALARQNMNVKKNRMRTIAYPILSLGDPTLTILMPEKYLVPLRTGDKHGGTMDTG